MAGELGRELQFEREWQVAVDRLVHSYQSESFGGFSAVYCRQCDKIISSFGFTTHGKRCEVRRNVETYFETVNYRVDIYSNYCVLSLKELFAELFLKVIRTFFGREDVLTSVQEGN